MEDRPADSRPHRLGWLASTATSAVATVVFLLLQNIVRDAWQIRSLPERVMEWLLIFVPLDLFERSLQQFGSNAKQLALTGTVVGMAVLLIVIGTLALRAGWQGPRLLLLGGCLWVMAMAGIMPITGAGAFGSSLLVSPLLTNATYLMLFMGYASVLIVGRLATLAADVEPTVISRDRRVLVTGLAAAAASVGVARFVGRDGGLVGSSLPLASPPTPRPASATATPAPTTAAQAALPTATLTAAPSTLAPVAAAETPMPSGLAPPAPARALDRTREGVLTAAGRAPGSLAPQLTQNSSFYVVTKNAVADPVIDASNWRLVIDGDVQRPIQLDYQTLRALPAVEIIKTLECISNFTAQCNLAAFGCDLISTAYWRGARLADLLDLAGGLKSSAVGLACYALDEFSSGLGLEVVEDPDTLLVYEMNGQPLPREHGYPARLLVPGRYGMKGPKWVAGIRAVTSEHLGWYEQRNWNKVGIVKTMSRIDVPFDGALLAAGEQRIAGIAYAGVRKIEKVDFSFDDGQTWQPATFLEPPMGRDAWVRWESTFEIEPGERLALVVRATDGTGEPQTEEFSLPQPDGATGRHTITVEGWAG